VRIPSKKDNPFWCYASIARSRLCCAAAVELEVCGHDTQTHMTTSGDTIYTKRELGPEDRLCVVVVVCPAPWLIALD